MKAKKAIKAVLFIVLALTLAACDGGSYGGYHGGSGDDGDGYYGGGNDGNDGYGDGDDGYHGGGNDGYGSDGGDGYGGNGGNSSPWLRTNIKNYTVTDGVAGNISVETNVTLISNSYIDDKHYEWQNEWQSYNTYAEYETSSIIQRSTGNEYGKQNGNTRRHIIHSITETTYTYINVNSSVDFGRKITKDTTGTITTVYHEESGLTLSQASETTMTEHEILYNNSEITYNNSETTNNSVTTDYTIELLNAATDGVKTYKHYDTTTDGTGVYIVYKIKNGRTLETKHYIAGDILNYTVTYTFSDNPIIRAKLGDYTLHSNTYENTPASNNYQTCEVISDSLTELIIRIKTYTAGILTGQYDETYKPFNVPF